jgi:hypothetical protein
MRVETVDIAWLLVCAALVLFSAAGALLRRVDTRLMIGAVSAAHVFHEGVGDE